MNKVTEQIDALPLVEEIKNNETEVLPSEIQNIKAPFAPETIRGQDAATINEETDSSFRPLTETTEPVIHQYWRWIVIALGFIFTAAWICFLGYELFKLVVLLIRAAS